MPTLIIKIGGEVATSFSFDDPDVFVGRVPTINDLCIPDPSVSRQHLHIKKTDEGYILQDLKSLNGIVLNGTKVETGLIQNKDVIQLGDVEILVQMEASSSDDAHNIDRQQFDRHPSENEVTRITSIKKTDEN